MPKRALNPLAGLLAAVCVPAVAVAQKPSPLPASAELHHWLGVEHHLRRSLDEASREYARALEIEPARPLTPEELAIVRRFAPRVYTTPDEPFPLKDFAAVLHPARRIVAYHFFWEDDIDFPDDNDPCDHELMWVEYSADGRAVEGIWMYFHGRLLPGGEAALDDARRHGMRPRVNVQWGKHGSMPAGWETLAIRADAGDVEVRHLALDRPITLAQYNEGTHRKLAGEGRRQRDHPIGRRLGWPERFTGTWTDFVNFSRLVEPLALLDRHGLAMASRWNSATIDRHFLAYNFRPKTEWPPERAAGPVADRAAAATPARTGDAAALDRFQLPAKAIFDPAMPRYPNLWFYVDAALAGSYESAVALVTGALRETLRLQESHGPFTNPEGCDFEGRVEHLQPWEPADRKALQHSHAFHVRYYHSALSARQLQRVELDTPSGRRTFYRLAASAHYEVEHTNPNHADVEACPICGRTGAYADQRGSLVERVHDPLGVELALAGTIRGEVVRLEAPGAPALRGVAALTSQFSVQTFSFDAQRPDQNTLRIGIVVVSGG